MFSPFEGFANPGLAFGMALAAVPLIIHLLNRQRHKPMRWAAMRFVLAAYRRTRRRARLENLLLLLLRMAAVALLALAVARPFTGSESPLSALTETRRDLVLVLDGSASTGYRTQIRSVFEDIVERARQIVLELDGGRGDSVRLLLAGAHPRLLSWRTPEEALSLLNALNTPTDESLNLSAALGEVVRFAEEQADGGGRGALEVRVLSDLQRRGFQPEAPAEDGAQEASPLVEHLDSLRELEVKVLVEDLGPAEAVPPNLGIESIEIRSPFLGPGQPVEIAVTAVNHGPRARAEVGVVIAVDGERRPKKLVDLPARDRAEVSFTAAFPSEGAHTLEAMIASDRLTVDDLRGRVVVVPPPVRVLLVNGDPRAEIEKDETGFLGAVLEPPGGDALSGGPAAAPFVTRVIDEAGLSDRGLDLDDWDVILLANVARIGERSALALEEWAAAGGSLIVTAGDRLDAAVYNRRLFSPDGSGLLPAELGVVVSVASRRETYWRVGSFDAEHPALVFFADERWKPLLTEVPIFEFLSAEPLAGARVLARLDDREDSPLLIERGYDRGRVFLWLTSIDPDWTRLPESPRTLIPLVHEWMRYAGRPRRPARNTAVGGTLLAEVHGYPRNATLVRPDGSRQALDGEPTPLGPNLWRLPAVRDTEQIGFYRIDLATPQAGPLSFAVQLDAGEGDLERIGAADLALLHPSLTLVGRRTDDGADDAGEPAGRGELWRWLAGACFAALVLESLWAAWVGRGRRQLS